jgi:hypothetical protein
MHLSGRRPDLRFVQNDTAARTCVAENGVLVPGATCGVIDTMAPARYRSDCATDGAKKGLTWQL